MDKDKLILIFCGIPLMFCSLFAVPLYYVLSGRVNERQNIVYTAVVTAFVVWWMYVGTVYFGEWVVEIFDLKSIFKYIVAAIMGLIYFALAVYWDSIKDEIKTK
jgi:small neutral amino acid transporter SnatA (MarC family)